MSDYISKFPKDYITATHEAKTKTSKFGIVLALFLGASGLGLSIICLPFVTPALRKICLPYVPATNKQVKNVFKALHGRNGNLIDLGSGDGRIVIEGAIQGFKSVGVELNLWLVLYSKFRSLQIGTNNNTSFLWKNIWKTSLTPYNNVVIFGVDSMMQKLEEKCMKELKDDSIVIACRFPFPKLKVKKTLGEGIDKVWIYEFIKV